MNKAILKIIVLLSMFLGVVSGLLTIIPFIGEIIFWLLLTVSAVVVILFMTKMKLLDIKTTKQSVVVGAIIGFISFLAFSVVYIPAVIALAKFMNYISNPGVAMFLTHSSLGILVMLAIFMGVLSATLNSFSGFLTYYLVEFSKSLNSNQEVNNFEQYNQFNIRK